MTTQISTIKFHNQTLLTLEQDNIQYVAMRPICENIGLTWSSQFDRISRDEVLKSVVLMIRTTGSDGKNYQMLCLPIQYLNGWLFGIDVKRVKPEIREKLITYKKECYQALFDYWNKQEPKQLALPAPEKKTYTIELAEDDITVLLWLWFIAVRVIGSLKLLIKPLRLLQAPIATEIISQAHEYPWTVEHARRILLNISKDLEADPWKDNNLSRVLPKIRRFDKSDLAHPASRQE